MTDRSSPWRPLSPPSGRGKVPQLGDGDRLHPRGSQNPRVRVRRRVCADLLLEG